MPLVALLAVVLLSPHADDVARIARDRADAAAIRREISVVTANNTFDAQLRVASLDYWLCEVLYESSDTKGIRAAAEHGIAAAERAVKLRPQSSEAHRLLGDLLGQLIPHVFAGGM